MVPNPQAESYLSNLPPPFILLPKRRWILLYLVLLLVLPPSVISILIGLIPLDDPSARPLFEKQWPFL